MQEIIRSARHCVFLTMLCCVRIAPAQTPAAPPPNPTETPASSPIPMPPRPPLTAPVPPLAHSVDQVAAAEGLPTSAVSYVVMDPDSGRVLLGRNTTTARSPASTIKLVTTFAALDLLGPAFTWHTRGLVHGELKDGILNGDLILKGGGDPYMTLERWWDFAHQLRSLGLQAIHGDIVVDNSDFSAPAEDPAAFDGRPNRAYNALPDALMVNFQAVKFSLVPNPETHAIDITADPAPSNLTIHNGLRFVDAQRCSGPADQVDFEVTSGHWDQVRFSGALSGRCEPQSLTRVLLTPAEYAYGTFTTLWRQLGGGFSGGLRVQAAPEDARILLSYDSLPLGEIVRLINKHSNNLMARQLLLTLGRERYGTPGSQDKGLAAINDWSRSRGLGLDDIDLGNGAGLSRTTHVSVLQLAGVLKAAYRSRYAPEFMSSLPLAGLDGTLRARMKEMPGGTVRLKTGHIDGVSGVAGYVTNATGKTYVLVCLINDARADDGAGEPLHAALVGWILANL